MYTKRFIYKGIHIQGIVWRQPNFSDWDNIAQQWKFILKLSEVLLKISTARVTYQSYETW